MPNCRHCTKPLPPRHGSGRPRKYCDDTCMRAWYKANRIGAPAKPAKRCLDCGQPCTTPRSKYCPACRYKSHSRRYKARHTLTCQHCSSTFTSDKTTRDYCSKRCGRLAVAEREAEERFLANPITITQHGQACEHCQRIHYPKQSARFCSWRCVQHRRYGIPPETQCRECNKTFHPWAQDYASHKYCSQACAHRSANRSSRHTRRARIAAVPNEPISLPAIAKRDGWQCHICKKKVTRNTWSLDHLIPISHGGHHTKANVALAHHRCNTLRRDTGQAQLLLVG